MALCIAAACQEGLKPRIVLCSDQLVSTTVSSSETEFKFVQLPGAVAMFSGVISEARELLSIYEKILGEREKDVPTLTIHELLELFRTPLKIWKRDHMEFLIAETGLTLREFMDRGEKFKEAWENLRSDAYSKTCEVDLLLAGFTNGSLASDRHMICKVKMGNVGVETKFGCIGTGSEAAEQSLHRREQTEMTSLQETLYHVYEAKRMGEQATTVGKQTMMAVMESIDTAGGPSYSFQLLRQEAIGFLKDCYLRFGPQATDEIEIPSDLRLFWP